MKPSSWRKAGGRIRSHRHLVSKYMTETSILDEVFAGVVSILRFRRTPLFAPSHPTHIAQHGSRENQEAPGASGCQQRRLVSFWFQLVVQFELFQGAEGAFPRNSRAALDQRSGATQEWDWHRAQDADKLNCCCSAPAGGKGYRKPVRTAATSSEANDKKLSLALKKLGQSTYYRLHIA